MYKQFNEEQQNLYEFTAHKNYVKSQADLTRHFFVSASSNTSASRYYHFARINFYLSGSDLGNEDEFDMLSIGKRSNFNKFKEKKYELSNYSVYN